MDVFRNPDAFNMTELSSMVERMDYLPQMLGGMNLFEDRPVRQKDIFIDRSTYELELIPFSARGSNPDQNERYTRDAINFEIPRLAQQDTIWAAEVAGLRESGTENELMTVQREVARRLMEMRQNMEYTEEYLRLGAIQGMTMNPGDGSVLYNYFTEFNITPNADISFELDVDTTDVITICNQVNRTIQRAAKGGWVPGRSQVHALVGDAFWDALVTHPRVRDYYLNYNAAANLRMDSGAFGTFQFGDIMFHNYRGSDDNSEVAIPTNDARFFVVGGRDIFVKAMAPADEYMPFVNTPGQSAYAIQELDNAFRDTPRFVKYHMHSYPLYYCQRPGTLLRGTRT
jgi:hypothetical protein